MKDNGWISVKDRKKNWPEKFRILFLYGSKGNYGTGCVDASGEIDDYSLHEGEKATHWKYATPPNP